MMKKKVFPVLVIAALLLAACNGCSSFSKTTYSSLGTAAIAVNSTMLALDDLYQRGYLSETAKDKIVSVHEKYRIAHRAAVTALENYVNAKGDEKADLKKEIELQLGVVTGLVAELNRMLAEYEAKAPKTNSVTEGE